MSNGTTTPLIPWDVAAVAAEARGILRMGDADADAGRIDGYAEAATAVIDAYLAPCEAWTEVPPPVARAAAITTVNGYRLKDAPHGVLNAWSASDVGPVYIGNDILRPVLYLLLPYKCGWGIA